VPSTGSAPSVSPNENRWADSEVSRQRSRPYVGLVALRVGQPPAGLFPEQVFLLEAGGAPPGTIEHSAHLSKVPHQCLLLRGGRVEASPRVGVLPASARVAWTPAARPLTITPNSQNCHHRSRNGPAPRHSGPGRWRPYHWLQVGALKVAANRVTAPLVEPVASHKRTHGSTNRHHGSGFIPDPLFRAWSARTLERLHGCARSHCSSSSVTPAGADSQLI